MIDEKKPDMKGLTEYKKRIRKELAEALSQITDLGGVQVTKDQITQQIRDEYAKAGINWNGEEHE